MSPLIEGSHLYHDPESTDGQRVQIALDIQRRNPDVTITHPAMNADWYAYPDLLNVTVHAPIGNLNDISELYYDHGAETHVLPLVGNPETRRRLEETIYGRSKLDNQRQREIARSKPRLLQTYNGEETHSGLVSTPLELLGQTMTGAEIKPLSPTEMVFYLKTLNGELERIINERDELLRNFKDYSVLSVTQYFGKQNPEMIVGGRTTDDELLFTLLYSTSSFADNMPSFNPTPSTWTAQAVNDAATITLQQMERSPDEFPDLLAMATAKKLEVQEQITEIEKKRSA